MLKLFKIEWRTFLYFPKAAPKKRELKRKDRSECINLTAQKYDERMQWFRRDRFGMFIHWGLYAIPARGEWVRSVEEMPEEQYKPFFDEFNPVDFDARAWARLAKQAGMKYAVLTAKHHDGFCLFDSKLTDWKSTNTPFGRDIVREFLDAFRAEGIRVGLYYSLLDWHHPDYPAFGDRQHPMRNNEAYRDRPYSFDNYLEYMHGQVRELCTEYGKLDLMWFDFSYDDMTGENGGHPSSSAWCAPYSRILFSTTALR